MIHTNRKVSFVGVGLLLLGCGLENQGDNLQVQRTPAFGSSALKVSPSDIASTIRGVPRVAELKSRETLQELLLRFDLSSGEAYALTQTIEEHLEVRKLRPGFWIRAIEENDGPHELTMPVRDEGELCLRKAEDRWEATLRPYRRSSKEKTVRGSLEETLIGALDSEGAPASLAYRMADVLEWDLDFNRDLRVGDRFEVLFEEDYLEGKLQRVDKVLVLRYTNLGRTLEAYRFNDAYYDAEGKPMRKMFLKSPLKFSRISSRFTRKRFHPVLKKYRPHYGVDYAAPTGTPVRVTANGVVTFAGWDRGGGRTVKIRHTNGYLTAYLHLSGFAKGMGSGRRVQQGEIIGYVGSTGLATGPHPDYRVQKKGKWIDPLSIKSTPAPSISVEDRPEFQRELHELLARMEGHQEPTMLSAR